MKEKETVICDFCSGDGYFKDTGEPCRHCNGEGKVTRKQIKKKMDSEPEILKHSPTVDEWIMEQQRKRGIIK
jgi:RecJ-like exonuclease